MAFAVYRSSAGSGKTYTLVKEYLKIALESDQITRYRNILAITFTNKAANEMKERVIDALREISATSHPEGTSGFLLEDLIKELELDREVIRDRAFKILKSMLHHYSDLSISTIDSFVHRVVRAFAIDLKLPINFEVELDADQLIGKTVDQLIEKVGKEEKITNVLIAYTEQQTKDEKNWNIETNLSSFAANLFKEENEHYFEKLRHLDIDDFLNIRQLLAKEIQQFKQSLVKIGLQGTQLIQQVGGPSLFYRTKSGIPGFFQKVEKLDLDKIPNSYQRASIEEDKWYPGKATTAEKMLVDGIAPQLKELYQDALTKIEQHKSAYELNKLIIENLYALALLNEMEKIFSGIKEEHNLVHISDFNKVIAAIVLKEPAPFFYERIGERYHHYLIDEFQDTSITQWQNLLPLVENSLAQNRFNMVVGDGKQSIYRFRGGEVEQFARLPEVYNPHGNPFVHDRERVLKQHFEERILSTNFRSKKEIIEFNNEFFNKIKLELAESHQIIYDNQEQLAREGNTGGYVNFRFIDFEKKEDGVDEIMAQTLEKVKELKAEGFAWKDICLLFPTRSLGATFSEALLEQNIPVISSESLYVSESVSVKFIVAYLAWLNQPKDIFLQAALLIRLRECGAREFNLDEAISMLSEGEGNVFVEMLQNMNIYPEHTDIRQMALQEVCEHLIELSGMSTRMNAYLFAFLDFVFERTSKYGNDLTQFLEHWEKFGSKLSVVIPEDLDAVQIMTIHKSKGLEFPVVMIPLPESFGNKLDKSLWLELDQEEAGELDLALVNANSKLKDTKHQDEYEEEEFKTLLDDINRYYVAFTRPSVRMYAWFGLTKGKYGQMFSNLLQTFEGWNAETNWYESGEEIAPKQKKEASEEEPSYTQMRHLQWEDKLELSLQAPEAWDIDSPGQDKDYGTLLHTVLSKIKTTADIQRVLEKTRLTGMATSSVIDRLEDDIKDLFEWDEFAQFFQPGPKIFTERGILVYDGPMHIPDRVLIYEKKAIIVDFKTGKTSNSHKKQIQQYGNLVREMGYNHIELYLIYTSPRKLVRVAMK